MPRDRIADKLALQASAARSLIEELGNDDAILAHDTVEGETDLFEAIDAALNEMDANEIIIAGCEAQEKKIAERRLKSKDRLEKIRGLIEQALVLADIQTVKRPTATLTVRSVAPRPLIEDEALIPSKFWITPDPKLDKTAINNAVKSGEDIPGVSKTNGTTRLTIRRV